MHATQPTVPKLFYHRDPAGWNNVRITFESLAVLAHLTGRLLIIPPPTEIHQLPGMLFTELSAYDPVSLASTLPFASDTTADREPNFWGTLPQFLRENRAGNLPPEVILHPERARLHHFECLPLAPHEATSAARLVLGLKISDVYERASLNALERARLAPGAYHAVHLRRGDFATHRPHTQLKGLALGEHILSIFPKEENGLPLLIACEVEDEEYDPFQDLLSLFRSSRAVLRTTSMYEPYDSKLTRALVDTLLLAKAKRFAGTPQSTYSTGVWHWRARERVLNNEDVETPVGLGDMTELDASGACWERCTTFNALRPLRE